MLLVKQLKVDYLCSCEVRMRITKSLHWTCYSDEKFKFEGSLCLFVMQMLNVETFTNVFFFMQNVFLCVKLDLKPEPWIINGQVYTDKIILHVLCRSKSSL